MKLRYSSLDIACIVTELQSLIGMRVIQIYDIDHKTYIIKLQRNEVKSVLLFESGIRIHTTAFEWPKNISPSGFSMKLRKHLKNKRLESFKQLGADRIVDLQFGSGEAAYHIILELFDKGNIVLADFSMTILNVLRPHTEGENFRFAIREKYPFERVKERVGSPSENKLKEIFSVVKYGESIRKILITNLDYGPALIDHVLNEGGFSSNFKYSKEFETVDIMKLVFCLIEAEKIMDLAQHSVSKGYIIQTVAFKEMPTELRTNKEFHPFLFKQHMLEPFIEHESFNKAVDEYFSIMESQRSDLKALQLKKEAVNKVNKICVDQEERLKELSAKQEKDRRLAELITRNVQKVDEAILIMRSALAFQMSWDGIADIVEDAKRNNDPIAKLIVKLKLEINHITLHLSDPYEDSDGDLPEMDVDINLGLSAHANAKHYYDDKRLAAFKQQKTIESQEKVLKSAQKKAQKVLKEAQTMSTISKVRKTYWFEKFFWFISSENYLVISGRDQQQNELIVKRYLRPGDVYVHADIFGASSVVIKNPSGKSIPPKTLNEAGTMAVCYSVAWEAKVICSAWWVNHDQVSKTAPTGEYLTPGSFMIRGKKNFLLPAQLAMGFSFLFKIEESSAERHQDERCGKSIDEFNENILDAFAELDIHINDIEEEEKRKHEEEKKGHREEENRKEIREKEDEEGEVEDGEGGVEDGEGEMEEDEGEMKERENEDDKEENRGSDCSNNSEFPDTNIFVRKPFSDIREKVIADKYLKAEENAACLKHSFKMENTSHIINEKKPMSSSSDGTNAEDKKQFKRGQRSKLKKIKEKYKDQDEEEKLLRMSILQSAGAKKEPKKGKKVSKTVEKKPKINYFTNLNYEIKKYEQHEDDDEDERVFSNDVDMINFLTGSPFPEDELLFAVPVVAPYSAVLNYKYKVKLTPGTAKRGKAARTALELFTKMRDCSRREKELMNHVNDQILTRNLPGKVKLSAPQFLKLKK